MTRERSMELLENFFSYLIDKDLLEDFLEDRFIELSDEEEDRFVYPCIEDEEED